MVDVVAVAGRPLRPLGDLRTADELGRYVVPLAMAMVMVVAGLLTVQRFDSLRTWGTTFDQQGSFVVQSCEAVDGPGADQWSCAGHLDALTVAAGSESASTGQAATLITSAGAYVSQRPDVGAVLPVFYSGTDPDLVYPDADKLGEIARLYLSLLPRAFVAFGAAVWLLGWFTTTNATDRGDDRRLRWFPQRTSWKMRGLAWLAAGVAVIGLNYVLVHRVVGSLGTV